MEAPALHELGTARHTSVPPAPMAVCKFFTNLALKDADAVLVLVIKLGCTVSRRKAEVECKSQDHSSRGSVREMGKNSADPAIESLNLVSSLLNGVMPLETVSTIHLPNWPKLSNPKPPD